MLHFTFQNMRAFYGPWLRGLGLKLKKQYENIYFRKNKPSAEHQGPLLYALQSFAVIENLVRISL